MSANPSSSLCESSNKVCCDLHQPAGGLVLCESLIDRYTVVAYDRLGLSLRKIDADVGHSYLSARVADVRRNEWR